MYIRAENLVGIYLPKKIKVKKSYRPSVVFGECREKDNLLVIYTPFYFFRNLSTAILSHEVSHLIFYHLPEIYLSSEDSEIRKRVVSYYREWCSQFSILDLNDAETAKEKLSKMCELPTKEGFARWCGDLILETYNKRALRSWGKLMALEKPARYVIDIFIKTISLIPPLKRLRKKLMYEEFRCQKAWMESFKGLSSRDFKKLLIFRPPNIRKWREALELIEKHELYLP